MVVVVVHQAHQPTGTQPANMRSTLVQQPCSSPADRCWLLWCSELNAPALGRRHAAVCIAASSSSGLAAGGGARHCGQAHVVGGGAHAVAEAPDGDRRHGAHELCRAEVGSSGMRCLERGSCAAARRPVVAGGVIRARRAAAVAAAEALPQQRKAAIAQALCKVHCRHVRWVPKDACSTGKRLDSLCAAAVEPLS